MTTGIEKEYDDIKDLGRKLHVPTTEMFWGFKVESLDGELIHEHDERGHSWVRNAYNAQVSQLCGVRANDAPFGDGFISMVDVNGSMRWNRIGSLMYDDPDGDGVSFMGRALYDGSGVVVGTSDEPYHFDQYRLSAQCYHGNGEGQLLYQGTSKTKSFDGGSCNTTYQRSFINSSGKSIVVNEVGIYSNIYQVVMAVRDVVATPIIVPNDSKLTITYTISVPFPDSNKYKTLHLLDFEKNCNDIKGKQWVRQGDNTGLGRVTDKFKFGTASFYVPNSNHCLKYPLSRDFSLSESVLTLEVFVYPTVEEGSIFTNCPNNTGGLSVGVSGKLAWYRIGSNFSAWDVADGVAGTIPFNMNEWNHFALVKDGNTITCYVNGKIDKVFSSLPGFSIAQSDLPFYIAKSYNRSGTGYYYDNFRASKVARYTAPFAPPAEPFVYD